MFAGCRLTRFGPTDRGLLAVIVLMLTVLTACGQREPAPGANADGRPKVYKHSMESSPSSLDPAQSFNVYAGFITLNAYDTLYAYKYLAKPVELKPSLASAFPTISEDGLIYRIPLKKGVRFVDDEAFADGIGREVVADDVIYSFKRHFDPKTRSQGAWFWQGRIKGLDAWKERGSVYSEPVEGLRAIDPYTVEIELIKPYPQLVFTFATAVSAIVPREAVEHYGKEFAVNPVGSGPFRVVSYDKSLVVMEPNPNYRQEPVDLAYEGYDEEIHGFSGVAAIDGRSPPFLDRLEIHFIQEASARWSSLTKGNEVQYGSIPIEHTDRVLASKDPITLRPEYATKFHLNSGIEAGFVFNVFNMSFPEIGYHPDPAQERRNKALRCAIIKAFDWERRNDSFYNDLGIVFPGIILPSVPEFDRGLSRDSITRDVAGAKRILAENGWTAERFPELVYGSSSGVTPRLFFEQFRAWLMEIGYPREKIVLKQYATFGDLAKAWKDSTLPLIAKGWGLDFPDAENTLQLFYGPHSSPGSNDANYRNPEYDTLYEQASTMLPSPERTAIYRRMNEIVIDDCVAMTGLSRTRIALWHKDVIAYPDREFIGGFFLKYVDVLEH